MKSRINGVLVFLFASVLGVAIYMLVNQGRQYGHHYWMMNPMWMMGSGIAIILALFGLVAIVLYRYTSTPHNQSLHILQQRLAKGDISEEEYNRLRDILKEG